MSLPSLTTREMLLYDGIFCQGYTSQGENKVLQNPAVTCQCDGPEALVEGVVEDGVVAGGGHGEHVAGEEGEVVAPPAVEVVVEILRDVDDVEGQPAEDEHHQDGHQEAAPPPAGETSHYQTVLFSWLQM